MKFTKMHGCGNDYVYVNCFEETVENPGLVSKKISDRHFGIGSDGLILICPSNIADFRMEMYNSDGSEGAMCGNGVRCIAKYVYDYGLTDKTYVSLETKAGIKYLDMTVKDGKVAMVKVDMGAPITKPDQIPAISDKEIIVDEPITVDGQEYRITCVSMGNPHGVVFVDDTDSIDIEKIGPKFEHHEMFPDRTNTEFIQIIDRNNIKMRVWERGAGETLACGTGTCASVYACILNGLTEKSVDVHLLGGCIHIDYDEEKNTIYMTGPAEVAFDGEIKLETLR
ncbi:MAG: diaminopimelate epimerase [Anaerostipes sp.]|nr:diaminopimelate epimerase [Anaerostipes sp.]MDD5968798.1 diaminopimelate epimerase [Anaerostipes sp.]